VAKRIALLKESDAMTTKENKPNLIRRFARPISPSRNHFRRRRLQAHEVSTELGSDHRCGFIGHIVNVRRRRRHACILNLTRLVFFTNG
jgi:hypothetical protein